MTKTIRKQIWIPVVVSEICDKCGTDLNNVDTFDAFNCEMEVKTGESYPEGGSGDLLQLDLCEKCALEAFALLEENGFKVQKKEWDC